VTMSQHDALAELRTHKPAAPAEVRDRVRLIAGAEPAGPRRFGVTWHRLSWRRAGLVLAPALVAVLAATIALRGNDPTREAVTAGGVEKALDAQSTKTAPSTFEAQTDTRGTRGAAITPAPNTTRIQDYDAYLRLRVKNGDVVSDSAKRAVAVARSLGGYASYTSVDNGGPEGSATIRLRIPIQHVQEAVAQLSGLGTIVSEQVEIQDLTAGVNAVDRQIARLQRRLRELRAQPQTDETTRRIESLTRQVERLQRGRAATIRQARLATVTLELTTREAELPVQPEQSSRLDGAWTALGWIGIVALYGLILGTPFAILAAFTWLGWRGARRHAEARLLARS
jgi:uncharacterized protein DUF4349